MKQLTQTSVILIAILILMIFSCKKIETSTDEETVETSIDSLTLPELSFRDIRICTEMLPPPPPSMNIKYNVESEIYYMDDNRNDTIQTYSYSTDRDFANARKAMHQQKGVILKGYIWPRNHRNITVTFLDGDEEVKRRVTMTAKKWEAFCGIRFIFGNFPNADIKISFLYDGSWSYIGTYSQKMSPSMNFGWLYRDTEQDEYDRVVLHEFGHALGLIHEHQHPKNNIPWDREKVYAYYKKPPNRWERIDVDRNIFLKYNESQVNSTEFDPNSIMLYSVPASLTTNGYFTKENNQLSQRDKELILEHYPNR